MPVKIRLARRGRKKRPYYHIVIADARAPRDGKFIENIGFYNPMTVPATIDLDREKAYDWLSKGAQPTHTARAILKFKGVYYKRHLLRGVEKGALTEEQAEKMYQEWIAEKEAKVEARREDTRRKKEEFYKMLSGEIKPPKKVASTEAAEAFRENEAGEASEEVPTAEEGAVVEQETADEVSEAQPAQAPEAENEAAEENPAESEDKTPDTDTEVTKPEAEADQKEETSAEAEATKEEE